MKYEKIVKAEFISRPNRFIALVKIDGNIHKAHVKNTGRLGELLVEGVQVILEDFSHRKDRKTKYSLIAVYKKDRLVNIDSQVPNYVVEEYMLEKGDFDLVKREKKYGNSRFDIYYERQGKKGFVEVKGVSLEEDGLALFPDAPTTRGSKHILELIEALKEGYEASIVFLIQLKGAKKFKPHRIRDEEFYQNLKKAENAGVGIYVYDSLVLEDEISLDEPIEYEI